MDVYTYKDWIKSSGQKVIYLFTGKKNKHHCKTKCYLTPFKI